MSMDTLFLQEIEATILLVDIRGFRQLTETLSPVELGIALPRFYEHVEESVHAHKGRLVKFTGDGVLAAFVGGPGVDHASRALGAVNQVVGSRPAFVQGMKDAKLPVIDYITTASSGRVAAGELGTTRLHSFDVLGRAVNRAFQLVSVADERGLAYVLDKTVIEHIPDPRKRPSVRDLGTVSFGDDSIAIVEVG